MALAGIRVLDLTRLLPGAFCTVQLADMGADVIKVEPPDGGDYMRWTPPLVDGQSALFNALNRNKRSLTLNLKSDEGRELLLALAAASAVLVESNRPGVMDRLGLGWDVLHARNRNLVMCSITGYGQDGPFALRAGHDLNYTAAAGVLGLNGPGDGAPVPLSVQVADLGGGGLQAAVAVLAALVDVERGGEGRRLDVSMLDGAVTWLALPLAQAGAGEQVERGAQRLSGRYACYRVYTCSDGRHFSVGALEPKFWGALCVALGKPELVGLQFSEGDEQAGVHRELEAIFLRRTRDEWASALADLDACCEPVLDLAEVAGHPQVAARRLVEARSTGVEVRPAVVFDEGWRRLDPPRLGQHSAEVLAEVGVDAARFEELKQAGITS
ncbi:MAG TPA: CaiB/BaiF CoA-transferase family protein [Candidatus Dormibacteraeota bacterium]|nr:CaiB/BaiF CoA-transferase family protein [Candidatus Dormibacteraeota bacterium]